MRYASPTSKRYLWHIQQVRRRKRARREPDIDTDAAAYIAAVEAEDGEALEPAIVAAYDQFVRGCKEDGIFDAIKASCIMAGARTLSGALVPLAGPAPTNFNFVPADYDRAKGLNGGGSTKYLDSNYSTINDPNDNCHMGVFVESFSGAGAFIGGASSFSNRFTQNNFRLRHTDVFSVFNISGLYIASRSSLDTVNLRVGGVSESFTITDDRNPGDFNIYVFAQNTGIAESFINARLPFYSIGEALDLEALDTRVTALMTAIDEALS